jgi:hypothetical protein
VLKVLPQVLSHFASVLQSVGVGTGPGVGHEEPDESSWHLTALSGNQ